MCVLVTIPHRPQRLALLFFSPASSLPRDLCLCRLINRLSFRRCGTLHLLSGQGMIARHACFGR